MKKNRVFVFTVLILLVFAIAMPTVAAARAATCDEGDGGEMRLTSDTGYVFVLSYYEDDPAHTIMELYERYVTYTCTVNSSHTNTYRTTKIVPRN